MKIDYFKIGNRIRLLREDKSMTQEQFAELIESDSAFVSRIENGKGFNTETLIRISNALGVSTDYILSDSLNKSGSGNLLLLLSDCTPSEHAFMLKCTEAIKNILNEYTIK